MSAHDRRQRRILIGVALMFFAPLAVSFYLYYGKFWHPGGRVNAGELIDPARPVRVSVPPDLAGRFNPDATLAVSIEPPGGSPTGQPTGPVVANGRLTSL